MESPHLVSCKTGYNNVTRQLGRKALTEFEMRIVFQMSAAAFASLIDAPNAATLGLNRAVLFNEPGQWICKWRRPAIPSGGSPDGTGQWPVLSNADHFRHRHIPKKKCF